ncbi:hypothetical protein HPP92_023561 [Vanilla planifolia]|uniref:Uncharacterized protein n=1 Tax=Vanilla planifolia TaxID=51239 RepID=A0A835PN55_VANPL|nr:hypothetical protein HPP92_023826 [Vanilla planifolia]KAG0455773.1 hypothetical protein HPP92_023561 [Vanilla planifolia]
MESLISLVNRLQRACTALGDHGEESALPTLWDSLPAIAVVGGQGLDPLDIILGQVPHMEHGKFKVPFP